VQNHKVPFSYEAGVPKLIAQRCTELDRGARLVDSIVTNQLLPEIGREFLHRLANALPIRRVHILAKDGGFAFAFD
jgi:type VI secretion system protein VasG